MKEIADRIVVDEHTRFGKPTIKGTRVPVALIIGKLASDMSFEMIMQEYDLKRADILAALQYAAHLLDTQELVDADDILTTTEAALVKNGEAQLRQGKGIDWKKG